MPRLRDEILDCVIYLYRSFDEAVAGINAGGSGFVLLIPVENEALADRSHIYAVTNRHVIEEGFACVRFNTQDGGRLVVEGKPQDWIIAERDDLAVAPMPEMPTPIASNALPLECLITKAMVPKHDIGVGDDVLMVGRFINREGLQKNSPSARFGHISQMPGDPIEIEIAGKIFFQDDAFLCEVRSIGGYSGSPVFLLPTPGYGRKGDPFPRDHGLMLGVDFCHIQNWIHPRDANWAEMPHIHIPINTGMAGVVPAWKLHELIMSEKAVTQRRKAEAATLKKQTAPKAATDAAANISPANDANPNHREDFNSLLDAAAKKPAQED